MIEEGPGLVDCDVHPTVPTVRDLLPYLDDYWAELVTLRGMDRTLLNLTATPPPARSLCGPTGSRKAGRAGSDPSDYLEKVMKPLGIGAAILNPLHGAGRPAQRGHGRRPVQRRQSLGSRTLARPRSAPARL